jgi:hypothetical protein
MKRWFWILDTLVVVSFVVIGRDTHGFVNDWEATLQVALPFLLALSVGVGITMAFMDPTNWRAGLVIAAVTVIGGLALRKYVFGDGTASTFVWLTAGWMTAWMVGWRLVDQWLTRLIGTRRATHSA